MAGYACVDAKDRTGRINGVAHGLGPQSGEEVYTGIGRIVALFYRPNIFNSAQYAITRSGTPAAGSRESGSTSGLK
jgi:hypothetical protein